MGRGRHRAVPFPRFFLQIFSCIFSGEVLYNRRVIIQERKRRMTDAIVQWLLSAGEENSLRPCSFRCCRSSSCAAGCPPAWQWGFRSARPFSRRCSAICFPFRLSSFSRAGALRGSAPISRASGAGSTGSSGRPGARATRSCAIRRGGLLLFVAVPLPGTGAWTGALIAALLDLRLKLAVPAITAGVFLAGIIISLLTYGAAALL